MKQINNLVFLPNTGSSNFRPPSRDIVDNALEEQSSSDFPNVSQLGQVYTRHSKEGMVPIKGKKTR
jgi:hypothetical protein